LGEKGRLYPEREDANRLKKSRSTREKSLRLKD